MQEFLRKCIGISETVGVDRAKIARKALFLLETTYHCNKNYFIIIEKGMIDNESMDFGTGSRKK